MFRKCTDEEVDGVIGFFKLLTTSTVDFICKDLDEDSDKCDRLTIPNKPQRVSRPKSFIFPLIDILNSLPE